MASGSVKGLTWQTSSSLEAVGLTSISLTGITFRELMVVVMVDGGNNKEVFYLPREALPGFYRMGGYSQIYTPSLVTIYVEELSVRLLNASVGTIDYVSTTKTKVYYR